MGIQGVIMSVIFKCDCCGKVLRLGDLYKAEVKQIGRESPMRQLDLCKNCALIAKKALGRIESDEQGSA